MIPWDDAAAERGGYETYMLKEIHEQPQAVGETLARNLRPDASSRAPALALASVGDRDLAGFRRIVIVACGTAYHAGLVGRLAIEEWANLPCDVEVASEWRYRSPRVDDDTLVVGISQSGETADTLGALRLARGLGARTLAITNSPGSQVTREVDARALHARRARDGRRRDQDVHDPAGAPVPPRAADRRAARRRRRGRRAA